MYLFQPISGGKLIAQADIHIPDTTILILVMVTLCCLALVMQKITHALSTVIAVSDQMVAMADITDIAPYIWNNLIILIYYINDL